jgi:hypothetical protein
LDDNIKRKVLFEIALIDESITRTKPLRDLCKLKPPDIIEKSAVALLLQSFYNGIENILVIIVKHFDSKIPNTGKWHKELLEKAFDKTENRIPIFRSELKPLLNDYMSMRHFVRHTYGFRLDWEQMQDLTNGIENTWTLLKEDLEKFLNNN